MGHIDLLHLARRLYRDQLPSRTLGSLEVALLDLQRSEEEVPGWLIPQLYFDYLRTGDARPMRSVLYHNSMDVISMAALLSHFGHLLEDPFNDHEGSPFDHAAIGRLSFTGMVLNMVCLKGYSGTPWNAYRYCINAGVNMKKL
jgi:hypothetical protein